MTNVTPDDWRQGVIRDATDPVNPLSISALALKYQRTRPTIRRVLHEHNVERPQVAHRFGRRKDADKVINDPALKQLSLHIEYVRSVVLKSEIDEMADQIGLPRSKLRRIIKQTEPVTVPDLRLLSEKLDINLSHLFSNYPMSKEWKDRVTMKYAA